MRQIRNLHLVGATGQIRTANYNDKEHLVVPIVAMVENVVFASNADTPEFVPAEELAETPHQWNGRGCFAGHPKDNGSQITANTPRTLEKSFGLIFDTVNSARILQTRSLEFNAWLDPIKAEAVGPDAVDVIRRLKAGERVEVSIGCYVDTLQEDGTFNGKAYHGRWTNIVSDHLAFIEAGGKGACSGEMGCGAPRGAVRHAVEHVNDAISLRVIESPEKEEPMADEKKTDKPVGLFRKLVASFMRQSEAGMSDTDLRYAVDAALRAVEPGYQGIDEIYPDGTDTFANSHVIYYVMPEDEWKMKRRSYTLTAGNVATLTEDAIEVEAVTEYKPIRAAEAAPTPCSCGGKQAKHAETQPTTEESVMREDVKALLDAGKITDAEAKVLEGIPAEKLTALMAKPTETPASVPTVVPEPKAAAAAVTPPVEEMTEEQWFAKAPKAFREMHERNRIAEETESNDLVTRLAAAQKAIPEDRLKQKSLPELRELAAVVNLEQKVNYSGLGVSVPRAVAQDTKVSYTPPNPYAGHVKGMDTKH